MPHHATSLTKWTDYDVIIEYIHCCQASDPRIEVCLVLFNYPCADPRQEIIEVTATSFLVYPRPLRLYVFL